MYLTLYQMATSLWQADNSIMIDVSKCCFVSENRTVSFRDT
jgi:hypothetical protein